MDYSNSDLSPLNFELLFLTKTYNGHEHVFIHSCRSHTYRHDMNFISLDPVLFCNDT
jgi:hypothetical protein